MKEQLITFKTAELAKEKGLNDHFFHKKGEDSSRWVESNFCFDPNDSSRTLQSWSDNISNSTNERLERLISVFSQSLLQRWLREKHWIDISIVKVCVGSDEMEYAYEIQYLPKKFHQTKRHVQYLIDIESFKIGPSSYSGAWFTYEEALEKALQEALKLIK